MITFGQAKQKLYKTFGIQANHTDLADLINQAQEQLMNDSALWHGTEARMRFCVSNSCITMPREVLALLKICTDEYPANIFNRWYEFLGYGTGTLENESSAYVDFVDLGDGFCTHTDVITAREIIVITDSREDTGSVLIRGLDENGLEVRQNGELGEYVAIDGLNPRYSVNKFSQVSAVIKPITKGYVYLSSYNPATNARINLASFHPDETSPSYRRYHVTGISAANCATVTARARLRYIAATHDSDTILIQNLPAIEYMMQAIKRFRAADMDGGAAYKMLAIQQLDGQLAAVNGKQNQIDVDPNWGGGGVMGIM